METNEIIHENNTAEDEHDRNVDATAVYGFKSRAVYAAVYSVSVILSIFTMYAMARTRKTPFAAKFLAAGLLLFDSMHSVFSIARKFASDPLLVTSLITATNVWTLLSLLTIWMSVIERYLLFSRPNMYLSVFIGSRIRWFVTILWISQVFMYVGIRYGVCYLRYHTMKMFSDAEVCSQITTREFIILISIFLVTSAFAYVAIIKIIREKTVHKKLSLKETINKLRRYKSTAVVFIHIVSTTMITLSIGVTLFLVESGMVRASGFRFAADIMLSINSFMDPVLYAFWYPECRLKLLEMLGYFSDGFKSKAISMRYSVYGIVPTKKRPNQPSNKVHPPSTNSYSTNQHTISPNGICLNARRFSSPSKGTKEPPYIDDCRQSYGAFHTLHVSSKSVRTYIPQASCNAKTSNRFGPEILIQDHNQRPSSSNGHSELPADPVLLVLPSSIRYDNVIS